MKAKVFGAVLVSAMLLATPAIAQDDVGCVTVAIEWSAGTPQRVVTDADAGVATAVVGNYLWVQYLSDGSTDSLNNVVSQEIPAGATEMTLCTTLHAVDGPVITAPVESITIEQPDKTVTVVAMPSNRPVVEGWVSRNGFRIV